jgi:hypothetical protein
MIRKIPGEISSTARLFTSTLPLRKFKTHPILGSSLRPPLKACTIFSMNADALHVILVTFLVAIYLVAVSYLRRRKMSNLAYAFWGTFALLLPAFGPFFVIAYRPGELVPRQRSRHGARAECSRSIRK